MATTIIGPTVEEFPKKALPAVVQARRLWSDPWTVVPELEFQGANLATASHDLGACVLLNRYGAVKRQWQDAYKKVAPRSWADYWVRVLFAGDGGLQEAWVGRIAGEGRDIYGRTETPFGPVPSGAQHLEAYGPLHILRRIHVGRSYWRIGDETETIDWVPPLNEKYGRNDLPGSTKGKSIGAVAGAKSLGSRCGNRCEEKITTDNGRTYLYGGTDLWTYRQYAAYLLAMFADERATNGPRWTLGGQTDLLDELTDPIQFGATQTVDQILRALIRPNLGMDYKIIANDDGFEVYVFALTGKTSGWRGHSLPANPDTVKVYSSRTKDNVQTTVARTGAQRYGTIRLLGDRIVVCGSLYGSTILRGAHGVKSSVPLWSPTDASGYLDGTGTYTDAPFLHDEARRQEKYRDVFRKFGADLSNADTLRAPRWNGHGKPIEGNGAMQHRARSTLSWLPLEQGVDYSKDPPVDSNADDASPTLRVPQAWLYDADNDKWVPVDEVGIGLSVLTDKIGIFLHANPNHLLAKNYVNWEAQAAKSDYAPLWDYTKLIYTVAYMTDQRVVCEETIKGARPSDGVLEVDASDCQLWFLAPDTMLDTDLDGQPILSPSGDGVVLRSDWSRMSARMAGVLARYYQDRARARIVVRGLLPWGGLIGQILSVIDEGGDVQTIESPITQIEWHNDEKNPTTVICTGFAAGD